MSNELTVFENATSFESAQRMATALSKSSLVPKEYIGNMPNCLIALEIAGRLRASPLMVMQNLYLIHGRPSWSSQFVISAINTCGRFSPLQFKLEGEGSSRTCVAHTKDKEGEVFESPEISIKMAKDEGWYDKKGSKWKTMPDLMLRYRAASFFGRLYAPEVLMGMYTEHENSEMGVKDVTPTNSPSNDAAVNKFIAIAEEAPIETQESPSPIEVVEKGADQNAVPLLPLGEMPCDTKEETLALADELMKQIKATGDKAARLSECPKDFFEKLDEYQLKDLYKQIVRM